MRGGKLKETMFNRRCLPATHFCEVRQIPLDRMGKPLRPGYRLCKNFDCIEAAHVTQSRYIARQFYDTLPKLQMQYKVRPADSYEFKLVAKRIDKLNPPKTCGIDGCKRPHKSLNLCKAHYMQFYKLRKEATQSGSLVPDYADIGRYALPPKGNNLQVKDRHCHYPQCERSYFARGLCKMHYNRWQRRERKVNVRQG